MKLDQGMVNFGCSLLSLGFLETPPGYLGVDMHFLRNILKCETEE